MASTDARPVPKKNTAYRHYFAIRKNDGTLITTWADMDTELSADGAAFADATNEATEIGTSGIGFVELTAGEMNFDAVIIKVVVSNASALPYVVTLFPEEVGDIRADATMISGDEAAANILELFIEALKADTGQLDAGTLADDTITAASINTGALTADAFAADAIIAATLATGAITADAFAAKAITAAAVDEEVRVLLANRNDHGGATAGITLNGAAGLTSLTGIIANVTGNLSGSVGSVGAGGIAAASFAAGAIDAAAIADSAITSTKIVAGDTNITLQKFMEMGAAFFAGQAGVSSAAGNSTITYYKRDGVNESFKVIAAEADGSRAAPGQIDGF